MKFDFNDILIVPAITSTINSRSETNPYHKNEYGELTLPLITAPMDTVINYTNKGLFKEQKIRTCLPRHVLTDNIGDFQSYSLDGMCANIHNLHEYGSYLIDIANGHMDKLISTIKDIKMNYPNIVLMVGNIANPKTYKELSDAGADYIRVGIGAGGGCLTSYQTGIGYPMASLISECYNISLTMDNPAKIVADGGMKEYSDIIKALALGADYVMLGSLLNKTIESCGDNYLFGTIKISQKIAEILFKYKFPIYKKFRGMSTKEVQKKWGNKKLKTSEGVVRKRKVEYTLAKWTENFNDYLRSAMSYTNSSSLDEFIGNVEIVQITNNSYLRFKK